jgi:hypothetical protein
VGLASADEVRALLAGQLGYSDGASQLEPFWVPVIAAAMEDAETLIREKLIAKGASRGQIEKSARLHAWHLKQSCYIAAAHRAAQLSDQQQSALDRLNIVAELDALTSIDGVEFGGESGATVRAGNLTAGVFNRPFVGRCGLPAGPFAGEN